MNIQYLVALLAIAGLSSCNKFLDKEFWKEKIEKHTEDPSSFEEIGSIDIGEAGAAEISTYDKTTKRLFVVNNGSQNKIDVLDLNDPANITVIASIPLDKYNGAVNSLDVHDGMLAAAVESSDKQQNGMVVVFKTSDYSEIRTIIVGSLPDMITFSPDGKYILTANEGEPNSDYTVDPLGTVSVISVKESFTSIDLDFASFGSQETMLKQKGLRRFGPGASFAQDMEPEYITVSHDSKTAWVTLQENNAIAKIDLVSKNITEIFPLGFKDYSLQSNSIDPSDEDNIVDFRTVPVHGMYQPDAISVLNRGGTPWLFTVNEGDVREYDAFEEAERLKNITLDTAVFKDPTIQDDEKLGRLNITTTMGDANNDGKFEELYSFGARSFSVWNGLTGELVYDSKNDLEEATADMAWYDDGRSDDKGVEPEGITIGQVGLKDIAFIGMERADAVAVYDISSPSRPQLLQMLRSGDAPEGVLFIPAAESPNKKSLLVVSSENDGVVKVFSTTR